jgi:hypothetical protein
MPDEIARRLDCFREIGCARIDLILDERQRHADIGSRPMGGTPAVLVRSGCAARLNYTFLRERRHKTHIYEVAEK